MMSLPNLKQIITLSLSVVGFFIASSSSAVAMTLSLELLGTHTTGIFDEGAAEISAYDPVSQRLFVVNGSANQLTVLDISNPRNPMALSPISLMGGGVNSVAAKNGIIAVAEQALVKTEPGMVSFFDTNGNFLNRVTVGALPDMLTFTPSGMAVLVANEGEPNDDYTIDPEGSISIIDLSLGVGAASVMTADFSGFNSSNLDPNVRIFGLNATIQQDLEPEYITINNDGSTAWITLQENNAIAILDLNRKTITDIVALGFKDHSLPKNSLDASNQDGMINLQNYTHLFGMYQPDAIASYVVNNQTYLVTANEGDARDYDGFSEEARVNSLMLDPTAFPDATIQNNARLGRLTITNTSGDNGNDGDFDQLYAFGARSFSIWDENGILVWDSGNEFEVLLAQLLPTFFNASNDNNTFDNRSDDKGPEPEGVTIGRIGGKVYGFIGLERIGGVMVYDITNPNNPSFVTYTNNRDFTQPISSLLAGDLGPEGVLFIDAEDSPNGSPLLVVANEISGSTSIFGITQVPEPSAILSLFTVGLISVFSRKKGIGNR